jgi:hypothetical protein
MTNRMCFSKVILRQDLQDFFRIYSCESWKNLVNPVYD